MANLLLYEVYREILREKSKVKELSNEEIQSLLKSNFSINVSLQEIRELEAVTEEQYDKMIHLNSVL